MAFFTASRGKPRSIRLPKRGLLVETRPLPLDEFWEADEVFLTSSGGGVIPVTKVDDRHMSNDAPGPIARDPRTRYFNWLERDTYRSSVNYDPS